jgi:hypothetical protein
MLPSGASRTSRILYADGPGCTLDTSVSFLFYKIDSNAILVYNYSRFWALSKICVFVLST